MNAELKIILNEAGQVSVTGPIDQKPLCYGLLEVARDVIAAHKPMEQRIVQPATALPFAVKGNGHG